jgi:hypothetical protein
MDSMIRPLATLLFVLSLFSCSTSRSGVRGFDATRALPAGGLGDRHPADIAVAPVTDQTSTQNAPVVPLREALCVGLVERLYTPLDLDYVDGAWSESAFLGEVPPDALLVVTITRWDTSRLYSTGTLVAMAELRLFEGGRAEGEALWAVSIQRQLELGDGQTLPPGTRKNVEQKAIELFAREALEELPARDPIAAHS